MKLAAVPRKVASLTRYHSKTQYRQILLLRFRKVTAAPAATSILPVITMLTAPVSGGPTSFSVTVTMHSAIVRNKTCSRVGFSQRKQKMLFDLGLSSIKTNTKVYKLSGGEQQRIALARLVLKNSELILCDEPTGSLDMKNAEVVLDMLLRLNNEGKTIVIVTHDPEIARKATRVITLNNEPLDSV